MDVAPRHIGVIGGMGPEATQAFVGHLLSIARATYGAKLDAEYPRMSIESLPLIGFTAQGLEDESVALETITNAIALLARRGVEVIAIPCNTVHRLFDQFEATVPVQVLNILEETANAARTHGARKIYVLGTGMTVKEELYRRYCPEDIELAYPSEELQAAVEDLITRFESGSDPSYAERIYPALITEARALGADAIILGCTELSICPPSDTQGLLCIDSSRVLAEQLMAHAYRATASSTPAGAQEQERPDPAAVPSEEVRT